MLAEAEKMISPTETTSNLCVECKQVLKEAGTKELINVSIWVQVGEQDEEFQPNAPQEPTNGIYMTQESIDKVE